MRKAQTLWLIAAMTGFLVYLSVNSIRPKVSSELLPVSDSRVVIAAPILVALFGGDRYLAANLETMRLSATSMNFGEADTFYLIRAQQEVAKLNPCHEDNYYLANGLLTWGGADSEGSEVLRLATTCRFWDEFPPFFFGFNKYFFERNIDSAVHYLEIAAQRATANAAGFRKFAIMLEAENIADEKLAIQFLQGERDKTSDPKLKGMLAKRIKRLEGLALLRDAQRRFEEKTGSVLTHPNQLIESGVLTAFPVDPLGLGYELIDGRVILKKLKVAGVEDY